MRFIGSRYLPHIESESYRHKTTSLLSSPLPQDGFTVQFLLLLAIALEWSNEADWAQEVLERAKSTALDIQMHRQSFAHRMGQGCVVLEESWRRTWWDLYIVDALFAGVRHLPSFSLWGVYSDCALPSEEDCYTALMIPPPRTLQEYDNRGLQETDTVFSSFTYLVDAARILGTVLATGDADGEPVDSLIRNAEANILSWDLYLPVSKRDPIGADGAVDEIMFQALMLRNTVATHLHRPRSQLHPSALELLFPKHAPPPVFLPPRTERHTPKALAAATAALELFLLPAAADTHSPFAMGALAIATHIAACGGVLRRGGRAYREARDRVRCFLGVLRVFGRVWPQALGWLAQLRVMARGVFEGDEWAAEMGCSFAAEAVTL